MKISIVLLALVSFVALTGFHGGCSRGTPEERASKMKRMAAARIDDVLDDVDATGEQRTRVQAAGAKVVEEAASLYVEHARTKQELKAEWDAKTPDAAKVHAIVDERFDALKKVAHRVADAIIEIHGILTPEQRAEISSWGE